MLQSVSLFLSLSHFSTPLSHTSGDCAARAGQNSMITSDLDMSNGIQSSRSTKVLVQLQQNWETLQKELASTKAQVPDHFRKTSSPISLVVADQLSTS